MKAIKILLSSLALILTAWISIGGSIDANLLSNPGFEFGLAGWTTDHGAIRQENPLPRTGTNYLAGSMDNAATSYTYELIDLVAAGFTVSELNAIPLEVRFGGWQAGWETQTDSGKIEIILSDGTNELARADLGWFYSNMAWTFKEGSLPLPASTRVITFGFHALRKAGSNNDAYLDDAFLVVAPRRPRIEAIERSSAWVALQVTNLVPGFRYGVLRSPAVPGESWTERGEFVAVAASTNWSEAAGPGGEPTAFYRIRLKP